MRKITISKSVERMNQIIEEMRKLNEELENILNNNQEEDLDSYENLSDEDMNDLIDEVYKEAMKKESYINTMEYHVMLTLRTVGIQSTYHDAKQFLDDKEDECCQFDTKHPWDYSEDEIIGNYIVWMNYRNK